MVITQDFGSRPNSLAQLVGVAYYDNQHSQFYQPGEGQGNVQIDATNLATGPTTSTRPGIPAATQLPLAPGKYQVTASLNGTVIQTAHADRSARDNVEQDFILTNPKDGRSRDQVINSIIPADKVDSGSSVTRSRHRPRRSVSAPQAAATYAASVASQAQPASAPSVNYNPSLSGNWTSWKAQLA